MTRVSMRKQTRRWIRPVLGLAISLAFIWLLARGVDLDALAHAFSQLSIPFIVLALSCLAAGYAARIVRWWWMLRALEPSLPVGACVWPLLTSVAVNNVMPFRAGDAVRVFGFRKELRSPAVSILGTLVVERLLDLLVLLGFFFLGLFELQAGAFPYGVAVAATWLAGACLAALVALILFAPWLDRIVGRFAQNRYFANRNWSEAIAVQGSNLVAALSIIRSPSRLLVLLGLSLVTWICEGAVFAVVARALNATASLIGPWFSLATGTLATMIPSSPGYVGTFDYFAAQGLAAQGAAPATSVAFALTVHAVLWVPLTALGLVYLVTHSRRFWMREALPAPAQSEE